MIPGARRAAAALAVAGAALWAFLRFGGKPPAPVAAKPAPVAAKPAPRPAPAVPVEPAKIRGAGLRDKGEALGGTPP